MRAQITLEFGELGYIAQPYWPEVEWLIKLEQRAAIHPKHGSDKKRALLQSQCDEEGISLETVEAARKKIAEEKFYKDANGHIYIPRHQFSGALVQALSTHKLKKQISKDQLRTFIIVGDLAVNPQKTEKDTVFARYIKNAESNLRRFQEDEVINNFEAIGEVHFSDEIVDPDSVESLIAFAGMWVGIGSCRKMGRGKFTLKKFEAKQ